MNHQVWVCIYKSWICKQQRGILILELKTNKGSIYLDLYSRGWLRNGGWFHVDNCWGGVKTNHHEQEVWCDNEAARQQWWWHNMTVITVISTWNHDNKGGGWCDDRGRRIETMRAMGGSRQRGRQEIETTRVMEGSRWRWWGKDRDDDGDGDGKDRDGDSDGRGLERQQWQGQVTVGRRGSGLSSKLENAKRRQVNLKLGRDKFRPS